MTAGICAGLGPVDVEQFYCQGGLLSNVPQEPYRPQGHSDTQVPPMSTLRALGLCPVRNNLGNELRLAAEGKCAGIGPVDTEC